LRSQARATRKSASTVDTDTPNWLAISGIWIKTSTEASDSLFLSKHTGGTFNGYFLALNTTACYGAAGKALFYDSTACGGELVSGTTVNDHTWHQIVGVYGAGLLQELYVDGAPAEASGGANAIVPNTAPFLVGGAFDMAPLGLYTGLVDDVQLYNSALNATDVQFLFDHPGTALGVPEPGALTLLGLGTLALLGHGWRRWKEAEPGRRCGLMPYSGSPRRAPKGSK
jgi:hypothetical protein